MDAQLEKVFWKRLFRFLVPLLSILVAVFVGIYWYTLHTSYNFIRIHEKNFIDLYSQHLDADLFATLSDLKFLANQRHLQMYVDGDFTTRRELEGDYLSFIKEKGSYDQVRFLDKSGMERIRVNFNSGNPEIVPENKLQDKSSRYYFSDAFRLGKNEIFFSQLDLNVEKGKIEQPLKPMIRIGMPIFDSQGAKQGVLLLNYFGARLFYTFDYSKSNALGSSMLLNKEGFWLRGLDPEDEWGFMYPDKQDVKFQNRFIEEWQQINHRECGQFKSDNGLFTFITVRPLQADKDRLNCSNNKENSEVSHHLSDKYYWKIVSLVPPKTIANYSLISRQALLATFLIIAGLLFALSMVRTRSNISRKSAERAIQKKNKALEGKQSKLESALLENVKKNQELEKAYHSLKSAQVQLLQAEKMQSVGRLAAGVAHELNTPIQFIGDNLQFLQESFYDVVKFKDARDRVIDLATEGQNITEYLEKVKLIEDEIDWDYISEEAPQALQQSLDGIDRVAKIVLAMKEFSHPGDEEKSSLDLNQAIKTSTTISRNEWKYHAKIEFDLDPDLPEINCLAGEINQVILNMIINAVHAIQQKERSNSGDSGTIKIQTRREKNSAVLRISDNGTGIPHNLRKKIFDPFFTTKEVGQGTGQGLAIVYSIIHDKHDGTIEVESELDIGTTFIIRLPLEEKS